MLCWECTPKSWKLIFHPIICYCVLLCTPVIISTTSVCAWKLNLSITHIRTPSPLRFNSPKHSYKNRARALEVKFGVTGEGPCCYDPSYLIEQRAAFLHSENWNSAVNNEKRVEQTMFKQCSIQKSSPSVLSDAEVPRPVSPLSAVPGRRPKRLWNFSDTAGVCHSMSVNRANVEVNENHAPIMSTWRCIDKDLVNFHWKPPPPTPTYPLVLTPYISEKSSFHQN